MTTRFETTGWRRIAARPSGASIGLIGLGLLSVLALAMAPAASAQGPLVQTVASSEGGYSDSRWKAEGKLPDGRAVEFRAAFVHPEGTIEGTPAFDDLDLREPLGYLRVNTPPLPPWPSGSQHPMHWQPVCNNAVNPSSYSTGHAIPVSDGHPRHDHIAWTGQYFDIECVPEWIDWASKRCRYYTGVECTDDLGYDFFRVHFDAAMGFPVDGRYDNPYPACRFKPEGASESVEVVEGEGWYGVPRVYYDIGEHPYNGYPCTFAKSDAVDASTRLWADGGIEPWTPHKWGNVNVNPLVYQRGTFTVCGHREGAEPECIGSSRAALTPVTAGMVHRALPG